MSKNKHYPLEVRERAVRLVLEHQEDYHSQWAALTSIAGKFGCTAETWRMEYNQYRPHSSLNDLTLDAFYQHHQKAGNLEFYRCLVPG